MEQLEVKDDIHLRDVALNIHAINHLLEDSELPLEFVDGYIGELSVTIPWSTLLQDNCFFSIDGLTVTVQVGLKVTINKTGVNDPLSQTHCPASNDHYSHLKFVF